MTAALADWRVRLVQVASIALVLFVLVEVNWPRLAPQSELAIFAGLGVAIAFLTCASRPLPARLDGVLALLFVAVCGWILFQTEPLFRSWWQAGQSLGDRAGIESQLDIVVGLVGLLLLLEATRRAVGLGLPVLALGFIAYGSFGRSLPDWLMPHRGYSLERIVSQGFLHSQGVFGIALNVMFTYVFPFVVLGAFLEATGATRFLVDVTRGLFRNSPGAPAKVAVVSSGLMGSLSGSAVANVATTGTFTIPLMRSAGFPAHVAAGIEAAASSGGALVPPVMGAGAYMMLEIVSPPVTYLQIVRAAILPAVIYYLSLLFVVHLQTRKVEAKAAEIEVPAAGGTAWPGVVFVATLGGLLGFLGVGFSVSRAVSLALLVAVVLSLVRPVTRLRPRQFLEVANAAARSSVILIAAAACVGVVLGIVTLTGIGTRIPAMLMPLAADSLPAALLLLMVSSIVLGMGLPSAVCYLLLATLIGPALGKLGVVPLAAHFFIFYFGLMSMVTPPVALASFAASSIANSDFVKTSMAALRFSLVGFGLPFLFVLRPQLLMLDPGGGTAHAGAVALAFGLAVVGIIPLAASVAGYLWRPLGGIERIALLAMAVLAAAPLPGHSLLGVTISPVNLVGIAGWMALFAVIRWRSGVSTA